MLPTQKANTSVSTNKTKTTGDAKLRLVPSVDQLLRTHEAQQLREIIGVKRLTALARTVTHEFRTLLQQDNNHAKTHTAESLVIEAIKRLQELSTQETQIGITQVINATGVILHTNLGRAPLSQAAIEAMAEAARYCTVEYDRASGLRGKRGARVEALLSSLTGAEDALVVNNCAAAALLILAVIAADGETLVSRGELVEIGGDFRVPDVMASSGTRMVELGTTNKTHIDDYRRAITSRTRLIMRVHPSNYRVVGFTGSPALEELVDLARQASVPLYEDAGSGQLRDLSGFGIEGEPVISDLIAGGADLVSFSGDKLLGSVQAGLIVGKRGLVDRLRRHPLYRALRSDKTRLAALEATLEAHQRELSDEVPVLQMLSYTKESLTLRAQHLLSKLQSSSLAIELIDGESAIGGGAGPTSNLPTILISLSHASRSAQELEHSLRQSTPSIVGRISDNKVLLDLRTVFEDQDAQLSTVLQNL